MNETANKKLYNTSFPASYHVDDDETSNPDEPECARFLTQRISIDGQDVNIFFDSGCGDMTCRKSLVDYLTPKCMAKNITPGPLYLSGVNDITSVCPYGRYSLKIPTHDGKMATVSGLCLDSITAPFPEVPMNELEEVVRSSYKKAGLDPSSLSKLPVSVGGQTDLMLGIAYLKYFPREIFHLPCGLTIYESIFSNSDGTRGYISRSWLQKADMCLIKFSFLSFLIF